MKTKATKKSPIYSVNISLFGRSAPPYSLRLDATPSEGDASCAPLSVGEIQDVSKLSLYPNPVIERLTLYNSSHLISEYEILNLLGESLKHEYLNTRQNKIEVTVKDMPAGIYFFKTIGESATEIVKFVKL